MLSPINGVDQTGRVTPMLRGGFAPLRESVVPAPSPRTSINAADLKIPGIGEGIKFRDEYIPSFPDLAQLFPDPAPLEEAELLEQETDTYLAEEEEDKIEDNDGEDDDDKTAEEEGQADDTGELSDDDKRVVTELQARDREVRAHEQAHISVGGAYIRGGATYQFERGPDDKRYAVGGEVSIDSSPVRDNPEATIAKMQVVRAAAMAPADPSAQDRAVAAAASREEARASVELRDRRNAEAVEAYAKTETQHHSHSTVAGGFDVMS